MAFRAAFCVAPGPAALRGQSFRTTKANRVAATFYFEVGTGGRETAVIRGRRTTMFVGRRTFNYEAARKRLQSERSLLRFTYDPAIFVSSGYEPPVALRGGVR